MKVMAILFSFFIMAEATSNPCREAFFEKKQVFSTYRYATIVPAPSAARVAVMTGKQCSIYVLSEDKERWEGPFSLGYGHNFQTGDIWPPFWQRGKNGKELLVLDQRKDTGVSVEKGRIVSGHLQGDAKSSICEPQTGRLLRPIGNIRDEDKAQMQILLHQQKERTSNIPASRSALVDKECEVLKHEEIEVLYDLSPTSTSILCQFVGVNDGDFDEPLVSLDLISGKRVAFPIQGHRSILAGAMHGCYSPDGKWVLMRYSYGPDDEHASGGYLQLFDTQGKFVCEIAEFYGDVGAPIGEHFWLHNNWLIYFDGHDLNFAKFKWQ